MIATTAAIGLTACLGDAKAFVAGQPVIDGSADLPRSEVLTDGDAKTYLLVFRTGQEIMKGLLAFAREHRLVAGQVTGIGALSDAAVGCFDPETKTYLKIREEGQHELLSLNGNLALHNGGPFYHVHIALGLRDGRTRGGHLFAATVRPTAELVLTTYGKPIHRRVDATWQLPLIDP